ncbi:hypothetical protein PSRA_1275 [Pseudoscardovia radai]|uniref:Uncharacterized protein n=1 Tax=Pseudoscardovia radai TaxID=987066 RepID=A0A261EWL0_9BIFI|nr:hypothetical protein [Pseudoscardovia radai]OZG51233.1 hypothetical protein PSRA_1275 [Pseudoscardovia radai]
MTNKNNFERAPRMDRQSLANRALADMIALAERDATPLSTLARQAASDTERAAITAEAEARAAEALEDIAASLSRLAGRA